MGPAGSGYGHLPSLGPRDCSPRGSHVGARRDFPSARANFAALRNEPGCPKDRGEVVAGPDLPKLSMAPAAHAAHTAFASSSLRWGHRESLRNWTSGASHSPRPLNAQSPYLKTKAGQQGRCLRPGPTWEARARSERPCHTVTGARVGPGPYKAAEASGVCPRRRWRLQVQNFIMAKQRSLEVGSPSITRSSLWSRNDLAKPDLSACPLDPWRKSRVSQPATDGN